MQKFTSAGRLFFLTALLYSSVFSQTAVAALPMSWSGTFGVDTTLINSYKRKKNSSTVATGGQSQAIPDAEGAHNNASFQTYLLRLNPSLIVNDSVSFKGELTTGYARGGNLGDSSEDKPHQSESFGNALYLQNFSNGQANVTFSQFYTEFYADTATFVIGRQPQHWGLGAVYDSGQDVWDRHTTTKDGITVKFKLGNFHISPYYFKIDSLGSLTKATNSKELGISVLYDSSERDLAFGILFAKKKNNPNNDQIRSASSTSLRLGSASVKIIDIFLRKTWNRFTFALEAPIVSGEAGHVFDANTVAKYKALGIISEMQYRFNDSWTIGLKAGMLTGEDGKSSSYDAMYLNPNYQVANLLFRYNLFAISDASQTSNIHDGYMVNTKYASLWGAYKTENWRWKLGVVYAIADEVIEACSANCPAVYNHANNTYTSIAASNPGQEKDYGLEVDADFDYYWNENVVVGGGAGYHFVGDYFSYTGGNVLVDPKNSYMLYLRAAVHF